MLVTIKPEFTNNFNCTSCQNELQAVDILWQGIQTCVQSTCSQCGSTIIDSLPIGHSVRRRFQINFSKSEILSDESEGWLAALVLKSLQSPQVQNLNIKKEIYRRNDRVIILNCIDYMYGHCLLKLLNAQRHLEDHSDYGLIVIIQPFLRWMIPEGVAEVWTVDIPLRKGNQYYPEFNQFVQNEMERFSEVHLSEAYSHPSRFDIKKFTKISTHDFSQEDILVTFIWREDRLWCHPLLERRRTMKFLRLTILLLWLQNWKICRLFMKIRSLNPQVSFSVAGLGTQTQFPSWIKDARVKKFDADSERQMCQLYSESRLVIGVHGSNMLLPSAHAGLSLDLMPNDRWGNFAQDFLYQEADARIASFRYRYLPLMTNLPVLASIVIKMISGYHKYRIAMACDVNTQGSSVNRGKEIESVKGRH